MFVFAESSVSPKLCVFHVLFAMDANGLGIKFETGGGQTFLVCFEK